MRKIVLMVGLAVLVGCGGAPAATEPVETPRPAPPAQPTQAPAAPTVAPADLGTLLVQDGDLPSGVTASGPSSVPPLLADMPSPDWVGARTFDQSAKLGTGVAVFVYGKDVDRDRAYLFVLNGFGVNRKPIGNIGDDAQLATVAGALTATEMQAKEKPVLADLTFRRCGAVVYVRMRSPKAESEIKAYGQRLDARLKAAVC